MICKSCGADKELLEGRTAKERGFHGKVCWVCVLEEQRAWRKTASGREYSRLAAARTRAKTGNFEI
jgi:hypothetical protein